MPFWAHADYIPAFVQVELNLRFAEKEQIVAWAVTAPLRAIAETSLQWKWTLSLTELWIASPYHLSDLPSLQSSNCPLS